MVFSKLVDGLKATDIIDELFEKDLLILDEYTGILEACSQSSTREDSRNVNRRMLTAILRRPPGFVAKLVTILRKKDRSLANALEKALAEASGQHQPDPAPSQQFTQDVQPSGRGVTAGPMSEWNYNALEASKGKLKLNVKMFQLVDMLHTAAGGFMDSAEVQRVRNKIGDAQQIEEVIDILQGKGDEEFAIFCQMLRQCNYQVWAHQLELEAEKLRSDALPGTDPPPSRGSPQAVISMIAQAPVLSREGGVPSQQSGISTTHPILSTLNNLCWPEFPALQDEFSTLVSELSVTLHTLEQPQFQRLLVYLRERLRPMVAGCFPTEGSPNLPKGITASELVPHLQDCNYWNYLNTDRLEGIIKHVSGVGSPLASLMDEYKENFRSKVTQTLEECKIKNVKPEPPPHYNIMAVEVNTGGNPLSFHLYQIFQVKDLLIQKFGVKDVLFAGFTEGSIILYFFIPEEAVYSLCPKLEANCTALEELHVTTLVVFGHFSVDVGYQQMSLLHKVNVKELLGSMKPRLKEESDEGKEPDHKKVKTEEAEKVEVKLESHPQEEKEGDGGLYEPPTSSIISEHGPQTPSMFPPPSPYSSTEHSLELAAPTFLHPESLEMGPPREEQAWVPPQVGVLPPHVFSGARPPSSQSSSFQQPVLMEPLGSQRTQVPQQVGVFPPHVFSGTRPPVPQPSSFQQPVLMGPLGSQRKQVGVFPPHLSSGAIPPVHQASSLLQPIMDQIPEELKSEDSIDMEAYSYPEIEKETEGEHLQDDVSIVEDRDKITPKAHTLIKAERFTLVCELCSSLVSDENPNLRNSLGTCGDKTHIKKMIVRRGTQFVPVRRSILPNGQSCKWTLCKHYPNCFNGDMCERAHGDKELDYWKGNLRPEYELCLDCKLRAVERILHNCHSDGHEPATVLYVDENCREIVEIPLPRSIDKMSRGSKFRVAHLPSECQNPQYCSFPHHQLAAKIMNRWREVTVAVSKPPNLKRYFEELQLTWQLQTVRMKVLGPRPKEELEAELKHFVDESLTCANYVQKFHLLIDLEEHTHMETLATKYNGTFTFVRVSDDQKHKILNQPYEWVGVLFMSSLKSHSLRQAATAVSLHFMNGATLIGDILQYPERFDFEPCLALGFPPKSKRILPLSMTTHKATVSPPQLESNYWRVDAEFILKHSYFSSLRKSLSLVPTHVVQRLVPSEVIVTNGQCENCDTAVIESEEDYPVLDNFNLDEEYQEAAFTKVMQADSSAPFIITGPFGAGKTRLIATTALRILLHNADCFILIATHHNKTATEYIEKYYKPLLEKTFDHKENLGVVRVVNQKRRQDGEKVTGDEHLKQDEQLGTDKTPTINSIEEYVKTVDELDSDDIDDYNLIITTFGVMLRLRTILKKKKCKFFTHIFVDEGAQAREPETIGAFSYAGSSTKIVIVGDHKQVGPQTHVLGAEARQIGLSVSLIARLHDDYQKMTKAARKYQAVMLSNHRTHTSILCLASSLFYESTIHSQSKSELHPDYKESVCFVCTSLDPFPACTWHDDEEYDLQVRKEVEAAIDCVKMYARNWPEVEWEKKDLGSLCVIVPNRHVERLWRKYAKDAHLIDVTCNVAYEIQGREFRAIFICTSEAVDRSCATRDPVKSLCDQYVFNTVITRARSLVMAFGNPFRLMEIERKLANEGGIPNPQGSSSPVKKCWETLFYYCLQCNSLFLSEDLGQQRQESRQCALDQSKKLLELESVMFERATEGLLKLDQLPEGTADSIMNEYNMCFEDQNENIKLSTTAGGQFAWTYGSSKPVRPPPMEAHVPPGTRLIECRLWQDTQHQCIAVPLDPKQKLLQVKGVENRRCAFEGALVQVRVLDQSGDYGAVHTVEEQGSVQPQICEMDRLYTNVFIPVDKKTPRLINMAFIARSLFKGSVTGESFEKDQEKREQYVLCFDPVYLEDNKVLRISHIIPKEVASHLLFVVCPLRWSWEHRYPLGAVVAALPKGISELYANKVLSIQYQIPAPGSDTELHGVEFVEESLPAVFNTAIGIVSRGGHSSVALSVDSKGPDGYVVCIHVCNVADLVEQSEEFKEATFHRWAGVFDQSEEEYHPTLPKGIVQGLSFTNGSVRKSITFNVQVHSPGIGELLMSKEVLTKPQNIALQHTFEESTVNCGVMLEVTELEEMLLALFGNAHVHEQLQEKVATCTLPLWEMVTALYLLSDHLCFLRQNYTGYPELQQVPEAFLYPEAWKLLHELLNYASSKAASFIGTTFHSETLLKVQDEPPQEIRQKICDEFAFLLNFIPFYQWIPRLDNIQPGSPDFVFTESNYQTLLNALQRFDVLAFRQLLMQPYHHPQLAVLEAQIREALPREEFAVKKIASKSKQVHRRAVEDLIKDAGGKHHSLQGVVSPYSAPFDNVFDIYIQYMLLQAIRKQRHTKDGSTEAQPSGLAPNLRSVVRSCNMATANSKKYDSSVASLNLAIHGQWSSICVEAFVKEMKNGNIQLCYPDHALQSIFSVQAIETKYVTSSNKAKFVLYTARVTCVDKPCHMLSNIHDYTFLSQPTKESEEEEEAKTASMSIFYHKEGRLAKCRIAPHYESPTVSLSKTVWHEATKFVVTPQKEDAGKLKQFLNQNIIREETVIKTVQASQKATEEEVRGAPLFILKMPFLLTPCQVVKVWLRTDMNEYVLTPKPQLIELNSDVRICLQHKSDILSCFTQCAFAEPSKAQYSSYTTYSKIWGELVLAEAAYNSVNGTDQYIFTDFELNFSGFHIPPDCTSEEVYEPIGDIWAILPQKFLARLQDIFPIEQGYFACFRFDVELKEDEEEDRALLERHKDHLYPGATDNHVRIVMHMVVDHVTKVEDEEEEEVRMTLEERVIQNDLMVKFKVVGRHNARLSPLMKDVLKMKKPRCEMQVFQMFLPIRKVYQAFKRLTREDCLVADVALGRLNKLVGPGSQSEFSAETIENLLLQNRYVLHHWDKSGIVLNDIQTKTLMSALMNRFQLIQGPPGTGKSITGAHIAYAFALLNRERKCSQEEADEAVEQTGMTHSTSGLPPLKCVLYCGPSNASVDVVLDHLDGIARTSADSGGLRILRLYGKSIEKQYHDHPYYEEDLFGKTVEYDIKQGLQIYSLHHLVRSESSYKKKIKDLEDKFRALHEKGFIPIADERFEYRECIRKAEEEVIKRGNFDILLCTCNETSGYRFRSNVSPIQCIIDEAGMTTEPEAIVALSQAEQAVLIGDHMQLQPVVQCREAAANGLAVSLFERYACLLRKKYPEGCLNFQQLLKQYRMVPAICEFPSKTFYENTLISKCTNSLPINEFWLPKSSGPIVFCDVVGTEEDEESKEEIKNSKKNEKEADKTVEVVRAIDALTRSEASIAVITPYRAQKLLITKKLGKPIQENWTVMTVDASQGSEADFVVLSMVRSKALHEIEDKRLVQADTQWIRESLGIVADSHRLCVALTRARFGLVIIGNQTLLSYDELWSRLIAHCKDHKYVVYRSELHRFPPKGPVNQAKAAAAPVGKVGKGKKPKSQAVAPKQKPADEKVRVRMEVEMEMTRDEIVKMLENLEEFRENVLQSKPVMWQELRKKKQEIKDSSSVGEDSRSKQVLT